MPGVNNKLQEGTKLYKAYQVLLDAKWHCGKHELPGTQAAGLIRELRNLGAIIQNKTIFCHQCKEETTHRMMLSKPPDQYKLK